jgi:hypothetical protein
MAKNSRTVEDIDEADLLQSVYEQSNPPAVVPKEPEITKEVIAEQTEKPKEVRESKESSKRKRSNVDYSSLFLQRNELKERSCVYISKKVHATISKIVKMTSAKDITVGGYIDNIIIEHLEAHNDEIIEMYNKDLSRNSSNNLMEFKQ